MRFPLLGKLAALTAVGAALMVGLSLVGGVVHDRQAWQAEAENSVAQSLATQQTLLGPVLQRHCEERWERTEGEGKDRKTVTNERTFVLTAWPQRLDVTSRAAIEARYRGIFKTNSYLLKAGISADWQNLAALRPVAEQPGARLRCDAPVLAVALSDARGIRMAGVKIGGEPLAVLPGSALAGLEPGLHAVLDDVPALYAAAQHVEITLELAGTRSLAWVPVGDQTTIRVASDWPHPSFAGSFLPVAREVGPQGFDAQWKVSALATNAQRGVLAGAGICPIVDAADDEGYLTSARAASPPKCLEAFGVTFIDPVNSRMLSDRAVKYGLLFIVLTFVGVTLTEVLRRLRVHPIQYLLVGCALTVFFLLLLSLGEHLPFGLAYLCAAAACTLLLAYYGGHVLQGKRAGLAFGAGIAALYGALYAVLQLEQTALVLGSILLFAVLAAVMVATRRIDWYALAARMRDDAAAPIEAAGAAAAEPV
jgi:inner membrane protein